MFTNQKTFFIKKWLYILGIFGINAAGCCLVYYTQNLQVILYIILVLKSKDILMSIMFMFNMIYKSLFVKVESEIRDEVELTKLKDSYGSTGSRLATGGSKAVKELGKEQKARSNRLSRDFINNALLELQQQFHKNLSDQVSETHITEKIIHKIKIIEESREKLRSNLSPQLVLESLFCGLR